MSDDSSKKINDYFTFLELLGKLKHLPRTGWVLKGIQGPETVASHMYRMSMMTFLLDQDDPIDRRRCLEMALVHDLAESIIGDITPHCDISPDEKAVKEGEAMKQISELVGSRGEYIFDLFMEYEEQKTPESKFVKDLDRFDMSLQAFEYERRDSTPGQLEEFLFSTEGKFSHPLVLKLVDKLYERRKQMRLEFSGVKDPNSLHSC